MKATEDLLASGMKELSMQERAEAFDDVHCVGGDLEETPEVVDQALEDFEQAVQQNHNLAYKMAIKQNRAHVEDTSFRLKFLRATGYDIDESVARMMSFLRYKAKYFGNDKVARDITIDDLDEEDMALLRKTPYHIQKGRDRNGRVIAHIFSTEMFGRGKVETLVRD